MKVRAALCMVAAILATCGAPTPPKQTVRRVIRFDTGGPNGPFRAAGEKLAAAYRKQLPEFDTKVLTVAVGGADDVRMLQRHEVDIGFSYADIAYAGFMGNLPGQPGPFEDTRGIALLQPLAIHALAAPGSAVHRISDLRGRSADLGGAASLFPQSLLTAFSLKPDDIRILPRPADDVAALLQRDVDAIFILGVPPVPAVQTALAGGAHLIPIDGVAVKRLLLKYPFYSPLLLRPQKYGELRAPVATIGINGVLLCRANLEDDLVYRLTKTLYEGASESGIDPVLAPWVDTSVGAATPVPLHPGAARYYRERELAR